LCGRTQVLIRNVNSQPTNSEGINLCDYAGKMNLGMFVVILKLVVIFFFSLSYIILIAHLDKMNENQVGPLLQYLSERYQAKKQKNEST
jgi:hypothetical protein